MRFDEHARLLFPEYVEELEDLSPAHIFQRRIHGAGYSYRQCFDGGVLNFRQYDAALSELLERHDFSVAARVAVRRLAVPFVLSDVHVCPRSRADGSAVRSAVSRRQNAVQGPRQIV